MPLQLTHPLSHPCPRRTSTLNSSRDGVVRFSPLAGVVHGSGPRFRKRKSLFSEVRGSHCSCLLSPESWLMQVADAESLGDSGSTCIKTICFPCPETSRALQGGSDPDLICSIKKRATALDLPVLLLQLRKLRAHNLSLRFS